MRHTHLKENFFSKGEGEHGADLADDLLRIVQLHGAENIAACFVAPIAGSTGVLVPPKGYLARLRQICDQYGILLVFDEVITGFGRTGNAFAAGSFNVKPDIITMAKAITNGAQPMSAVAASRAIDYVSLVDTLCRADVCQTYASDNIPLQFDYGHLTGEGSVLVAEHLRESALVRRDLATAGGLN